MDQRKGASFCCVIYAEDGCLCVQVGRRKETGEMETKDYTQEIIDIIRSNTSPAVMSSRLEDYHANDLAEVLKKLTVQERCKLYRILDKDMLSDILEYTSEKSS